MGPIDDIVGQHRQIEELFAQFHQMRGREQQAAAVAGKIVEQLAFQTIVEQQILFPLLRETLDRDLDGHDDVHHELRGLSEQVVELSEDDEDLDAVVLRLEKQVREHQELLELVVLPQAREALGPTQRATLATGLEQAAREAPPADRLAREHTKEELYQQAQRLEIPGRSGMSKGELAQAIAQRR